MIECPNCRGLISDRARKCVHCRSVFISAEKKICEECGAELEEDLAICSKCGCPIEYEKFAKVSGMSGQMEDAGKKVNRRSDKIVAALIIMVIATVAVTIGIVQYQKNKAAEEAIILEQEKKAEEEALRYSQIYAENLQLATNTMLSGAADAETCCNLIQNVWNNAIWKKEDNDTDRYTKKNGYFVEDFNEALDNLFADPDFYAQINDIMENQKTVKEIIKQLKNPPEEYKEAYVSLSECYDAYITFTNIAIRPLGSLNTFSSDFSDADNKFIHCYQIMQFYLAD